MKVNELTSKILLSNGFNETENEVYECLLQAVEPLDTGDTEVYYRRLYMYYNFIECRWSLWYLGGDGKKHLGYCHTVDQMNELLKRNNIDKEIKV